MDKQEKKINIKIYRDNKCIHVEIQDNGCGIKKGDLSYVINPFFTTKKNKFNFGLGLAYCDNVMQKHGGSFEIKSEYGIGTLICLKFPLNKKQRSSKISLLKKGYIYEQNQNCDSR